MWIELLLSGLPLLVSYACWEANIDEIMLLCISAFSSSTIGLLLWGYSRYLAGIYQEERLIRMKIRRERIIGSISKRDEDDGSADSVPEATIGDNKDTLPRKVLRISPVLPAFLSVVQGVFSVLTVFIAAFMVARIVATEI